MCGRRQEAEGGAGFLTHGRSTYRYTYIGTVRRRGRRAAVDRDSTHPTVSAKIENKAEEKIMYDSSYRSKDRVPYENYITISTS